jgi:hypothetical protein
LHVVFALLNLCSCLFLRQALLEEQQTYRLEQHLVLLLVLVLLQVLLQHVRQDLQRQGHDQLVVPLVHGNQEAQCLRYLPFEE